ncbi:Hypothetical protein FKW44_007625 [Caligus rogercresseyi]|uniref:Uncharacterized protein n=1 Tax=Caligus rogercresseyi TaxID=217165 RepID=A0A7T8QTP3_CALRO|nr:Hypothetical protein FKW44_007625 [Caligus rogercresseyi]
MLFQVEHEDNTVVPRKSYARIPYTDHAIYRGSDVSQFFYYATTAWLPFFSRQSPHMNSMAEFSHTKT